MGRLATHNERSLSSVESLVTLATCVQHNIYSFIIFIQNCFHQSASSYAHTKLSAYLMLGV